MAPRSASRKATAAAIMLISRRTDGHIGITRFGKRDISVKTDDGIDKRQRLTSEPQIHMPVTALRSSTSIQGAKANHDGGIVNDVLPRLSEAPR